MREAVIDLQNGILAGTNDLVKKIGGRQPTTLEEFITKHRKAFARLTSGRDLPVARRGCYLANTPTVLSRSMLGEQGLPELPLFLPVDDQRQPLELTQVNGVSAPFGPRQKQQGLLNIGG